MAILTPPPVPFVPVQPGRPPGGMIKPEADLLTAWLRLHANDYDSVQFNVRVGHGIDPGPDVAESTRQGLIASSQRRIDALLHRGFLPTIVEVKVRGSLWAIGQLMGYRVLWQRDNPFADVAHLVMVCGSIDADTAYAVTTLGIQYEVVYP